MKVLNSTVTMLLSVLMLLCVCMGFVSCAEKEEKYQIAVRLKCEDEIYEFPPDVKELHVERKYDGKEHYYGIYECRYVNHPKWNDTWFVMDDNNHYFSGSMLYTRFDGTQEDLPFGKIKNPGQYGMNFHIYSRNDLHYTRSIRLYVIVKE